MTSEERQLIALRGGQPDRVPVMVWLNPFLPRWATGIRADVDPDAAGYREVLEVARECADPEFDWSFPAGFFYSAWDVHWQSERIAPERVKHTVQTPKGPLTNVVQDRSGGGTEKHWVETMEDAKRLLSIPYEPARPDLSEFRQTRASSQGRYICIEQGAPGGGFMLALCAAPYEVPLPPKTARNLIRYMEAGRKYGMY